LNGGVEVGAPLDVDAVQMRLREFAAARGWERFHNPKNLAAAAAVEASELLEIFQWLDPDEAASIGDRPEKLQRVAEEVADVLIYLLRLADLVGIDAAVAVDAKISANEQRFPPE
jgi:NTP pyrophosphatase (non-canonical NTP hydrolase)